jgi:hypothetical protein
MEQDTKQMAFFTEIFGKRIDVDCNGGEITSDTGLLFLREIEKRIGIIHRITKVIVDTRHSSYVKHDIQQIVRQRVYQIASGYADGNDCTTLRSDPSLKVACDVLPFSGADLASQPTISRFENTLDRKTLYRIGQAFIDGFIASYPRAPEGIIIDFDDTADPTHGNQQLTLFNAYHDTYCYMPLHVYEGRSGKLITTILRPGKTPKGKEIVMYLKRIMKRIQESWPTTGIVYRGDSHYGGPEVYEFCSTHDIKFVTGLTPNKRLLQLASALMTQAQNLYDLKKNPITLFAEFSYQANSWSRPYRVIVKAEYNAKGPNTRFIVTNIIGSTPRFIYQTIYSGRGVMELYIKDHKNHLTSDRLSCSRFEANQLRLFLHSVAYVLLHTFRNTVLQATEFAHAQFDTIRLKILKIGARVCELATRVKFHLPSSFPLKELLLRIGVCT